MSGQNGSHPIFKMLPGDPDSAVPIRSQVRENVVPSAFCDPNRLRECRLPLSSNDASHEVPLTIRFQLRPDTEVSPVGHPGEAGLRDIGDPLAGNSVDDL